jgi:hypothetical protein
MSNVVYSALRNSVLLFALENSYGFPSVEDEQLSVYFIMEFVNKVNVCCY